MVARFTQWTLDVEDLDVMVAFWSAALGYAVLRGEDGCAKLAPPPGAPAEWPTVWLQGCGTPKLGKNRLHVDLLAADGDTEAEVARLVELGARHVDVGQRGDEPFVVLADPEDNEFCVLRRPPTR